jgi:hypothetical protein
MTVRVQLAGHFAAAALSLALVAPALAAPAGDEYLPKLPQSGASQASGSSGNGSNGSIGQETGETDTTTLPTGGTSDDGTSSTSERRDEKQKSRDKDRAEQITPVGSSGPGDSDGGDSGSILLNPIVLLMIAAVIAAAVGMTLRRRHADGSDEESLGAPESGAGAHRQSGPRTPDGEIVARRDRPA